MSSVERTAVDLVEPAAVEDVPSKLSPEAVRPPKKPLLRIVILGLLATCLIVLAVLYGSHRPKGSSFETVTVVRADFTRTLRLKGTTEAVQFRTITAPIMAGAQLNNLVITRIDTAGAKVKRGDLLVEFDRQSQIKDALDKQAQYQNFASQAGESQAQEEAARAKDETELKQAENELEKDKLEMRRNEILSRIDAEKNQEKLAEAEANLAQLRHTFELKRKSARAAIRILELQRDKAQEDMRHAQANADKMRILAPIDGVVVLHSTWRQETLAQIQEGDQVRAGTPVMDVVDPSSMVVRVEANQQDIAELRLGESAEVRLDAYPDTVFSSKLDQLAPLGIHGNLSSDLHYFIARFSIQGNNAKLMPDLSAAVDVELERHDGVLVIPRESVVQEGKDDFVWVKNRLGFHKQAVHPGARNDIQEVIQSGLSAGDILERNPAEVRNN